MRISCRKHQAECVERGPDGVLQSEYLRLVQRDRLAERDEAQASELDAQLGGVGTQPLRTGGIAAVEFPRDRRPWHRLRNNVEPPHLLRASPL